MAPCIADICGLGVLITICGSWLQSSIHHISYVLHCMLIRLTKPLSVFAPPLQLPPLHCCGPMDRPRVDSRAICLQHRDIIRGVGGSQPRSWGCGDRPLVDSRSMRVHCCCVPFVCMCVGTPVEPHSVGPQAANLMVWLCY